MRCLLYTSIRNLAQRSAYLGGLDSEFQQVALAGLDAFGDGLERLPVSYTHLDVYKRQPVESNDRSL